MDKHHLPLLVAAILLSTALASAAVVSMVNSETATAYEMLEQYGLPRGILPEDVLAYTLHPDGTFEMSFYGPCVVSVDDYKLKFRSQFSGHIQYGSISKIHGVSVNVATAWIGIDDVNRVGDQIKFHAGEITKSYPLKDLAKSPRCE